MRRLDRTSLEEATHQFETAIALDATNAAPHSALSVLQMRLGFAYPSAPRWEWEMSRRRLANRALELDPNLPEAHASLAEIHWSDHHHVQAERESQRAVALNPSDADALNSYGTMLEDLGRLEEALAQFRLAEEADPLQARNVASLAKLYIWMGRLEEAEPKIQRLNELAPDSPPVHELRARFLLARGDLHGCLEELRQWERTMDEPQRRSVIRALICALNGQKEEARALLRPQWTAAGAHTHPAGWQVAWVYCELGDLDDCIRWLMEIDIAFQSVRLDPRTAPVRNNPRFQDVLRFWNLLDPDSSAP